MSLTWVALLVVVALLGMSSLLLSSQSFTYFCLYLFVSVYFINLCYFKLPTGMHIQHSSLLEDSKMLQRFIKLREESMHVGSQKNKRGDVQHEVCQIREDAEVTHYYRT